ncbi:MAG: hypothetical protein ACXAEX_01010 [Promethearchaeota archaeon]|jgi:hypothetical protein
MSSFSPRVHMNNYKYAVKIVEDGKDIWFKHHFSNVDQLLFDYELIDVNGKVQNFKSYYQFKDVIDHLIDYKFIRVLMDSRTIPRIHKGTREISHNLTFEEYWSNNI